MLHFFKKGLGRIKGRIIMHDSESGVLLQRSERERVSRHLFSPTKTVSLRSKKKGIQIHTKTSAMLSSVAWTLSTA